MISVNEIMADKVSTISKDATLQEAAMKIQPGGSLLVSGRRRQPSVELFFVGDEKEITGILTETDIVRKVVGEFLNPLTTPVEKVMSQSLTVINSWEHTAKACDLMVKNRIRHIPVTENQKIVGMVLIQDLIKRLYYVHGRLHSEHLNR